LRLPRRVAGAWLTAQGVPQTFPKQPPEQQGGPDGVQGAPVATHPPEPVQVPLVQLSPLQQPVGADAQL
jgi:hypothetical protein